MSRYQCRREAARKFRPPKPTTKSEIRAGQAQFRNDRDTDRAGEITPELSPTLDAKALLEFVKAGEYEITPKAKEKPEEAELEKKAKPVAKAKPVKKKVEKSTSNEVKESKDAENTKDKFEKNFYDDEED